nr:XdhC family protein [Amylibacter cionae]
MPEVVLGYINQGYRAALATVIETWGSAPRPVGAQLAIRDDGEFQGSVSGGCVEGAVVAEALEALNTGDCRVLEYGVSDEEVFAVGLACGGTIKVLVEPVGNGQGPSVEDIQAIAAARKDRRPVGIQTNLTNWHRRLIGPADAGARFASDKSGMDDDVFTVIQNPPLRLVVVGAVHIAQALLPMARIAGYAPYLVDPRDSFASQSRFPGETILNDWPDAAVEQLGLDARTALVTLTHDPKLDTPALAAGLKSDAFYIGALGSTRTHAKRRAELEELGFDATQIARISGPVGLDIGAATPSEIALSIMAEMTQTLRQR